MAQSKPSITIEAKHSLVPTRVTIGHGLDTIALTIDLTTAAATALLTPFEARAVATALKWCADALDPDQNSTAASP